MFWRKEDKEVWSEFLKLEKEPKRKPFERHIPIDEKILHRWESEVKIHHQNSYGEVLKRDIKYARICNKRNDELLIPC